MSGGVSPVHKDARRKSSIHINEHCRHCPTERISQHDRRTVCNLVAHHHPLGALARAELMLRKMSGRTPERTGGITGLPSEPVTKKLVIVPSQISSRSLQNNHSSKPFGKDARMVSYSRRWVLLWRSQGSSNASSIGAMATNNGRVPGAKSVVFKATCSSWDSVMRQRNGVSLWTAISWSRIAFIWMAKPSASKL